MGKLYKRMLREIRSNFGQFLSIILIIAVGAMLMSGMFASITAMDDSTQAYYQNQNMADLWVYFKGITDEEAAQLSRAEGVKQVAGRYTISEQLAIDGTDCTLRLHSLTDINRPLLTAGTLPENTNEIILDYRFAELNNVMVGSQVLVSDQLLTVSGLCMNPEYAYKQKDAATVATSNRTFGIGYAQKETLVSLIKASDAYIEQADEVHTKLDDAEAKIEEGKQKLSEAYDEYNKNKAEAEQSLADAEVKLQDTQIKLNNGQAELNGKKNETIQQFAQAQLQIDSLQKQLDASKQELDARYQEYQLKRDSLPAEQQTSQDAAFESKYQEIAKQQASLAAQHNALNGQKADAEQQLSAKQAELDSAFQEYQNGVEQLEQNSQEALTQLSEAKAELDKNQAELSQQEQDYLIQKSDAEQELLQAAKKYQEVLFITDAPDSVINTAQTHDSYVTSVKRDNQPSYVNVSGALDPIRSVSYIFPLIFFFVAAVVAFISLSKTVENQRTQIAVMQALGISKSRIRGSFLAYSFMASILGSVSFAIVGNLLIPKLLIRVFVSRFELPAITIPVFPLYIVLPLMLAVLFSGAATLMATQKVLREIPAQAMRPRPPKGSKTIWVERLTSVWSHLSYSGKLILRNIFLNKVRIMLSSVGVIGSVMLILAGLSLRSSAIQVVDTTIEGMSYDLSVVYKDPIENKASLTYDFPTQKTELSETKKATAKLADDVGLNLQIVESGTSLVHVFDSAGKGIEFDQNSVIIPDSIAKDYGLIVGEQLQVAVDDQNYSLTVTGISVQYATKTMYLTFESAVAAGIKPAADTMLINLADKSMLDEAASSLSSQEGIKSVNTRTEIISRSKDMLKTLNATIMLILVSAAVLAITVIYNISSINIFERTREYATLMVLGYFKKEVNRMTFIENLVLSGFGCLFGLPLGYVLFRYLANVISRSNMSLPTALDWKMIAITIGLTFIFTLISYLLLKPKIKRIVLVEALKSVE